MQHFKYCMECKFLNHGIAIGYDHTVKPCCIWQSGSMWRYSNRLNQVDLATWHQSPAVNEQRQLLNQGHWPAGCQHCQKTESQGRFDSMRGNGNFSYADYQNDDITLEIRPGSVCNFACQTCWPAASSRVAQYYHQAGLIDIKDVDGRRLDDFEFLTPIAQRIKSVVLLGGEPFYDKSCRRFLAWAEHNLTADLTLFTNGSWIDFEFLENYRGHIVMVFSIDAVGRSAEYIRVGTVWDEVEANYRRARNMPNVEVRINVTTSVYNFNQLENVLTWLETDWPAVVSFGRPREAHFLEQVVPLQSRPAMIAGLQRALSTISQCNIESGQKQNAINAVQSIISNLAADNYDPVLFAQWKDLVQRMDQVKGLDVVDYCPDLAVMLGKIPT